MKARVSTEAQQVQCVLLVGQAYDTFGCVFATEQMR